jgi:hypothetical protein
MSSASSRRTFIAMLGLAPASAVAAEDMANPINGPSGKPEFHFGAQHARVASALRKLADQIEAGDALAQRITITSSITHEDFLEHRVAIDVVYRNAGEV